MTASRTMGRRGDGSAVVRGWVAIYTLGLPAVLRARRRDEVAGDLADETLDAVRHGATADLRRRRLLRWALGIPSDVAWRLFDAPESAARIRAGAGPVRWVPPSRWSLALLAVAGIGAGGAFAIVVRSILEGRSADTWLGWGPYGFVAACLIVLVAVGLAVPWPGRAVALGVPAIVLGMVAAPWLWGCWFLVLFTLLLRRHQAAADGSVPR